MTPDAAEQSARFEGDTREQDTVAPDPAASNYVERLREKIADQKQGLAAVDLPRAAFYVFFSFDLVNSTLYKTLNRRRWPLVTQKFYEFVEDKLSKRISGVRLWKYIGDEVVLYRRIDRLDQLRECLPAVHETLVRTIHEMQREDLHQDVPEARTVLSVKATVWCAQTHELPPSELHTIQDSDTPAPTYRNILLRQPAIGGGTQFDFLGPEIDAGFRISRYAARQRVVVSADLAYLLYRDRASNESIETQLQLVAFEQLKGVWGNRHYPIFWYENDWSAIQSSFGYDELFQNEIVRRIVENGAQGELRQISKIYEDLDRAAEADQLWSFVRELTEPSGALAVMTASTAFDRAKEVHCVAVCFRADGRVLIARRPATKRRFPGCWEFGCGQLAPYETFADCLRRAYRDDFGAELAVNDTPSPVRTYVIGDSDENREIPGIIFIAEVTNPEALHPRHHAEMEWIEPKDVPSNDNYVPDFKLTLHDATEVRNRLQDV